MDVVLQSAVLQSSLVSLRLHATDVTSRTDTRTTITLHVSDWSHLTAFKRLRHLSVGAHYIYPKDEEEEEEEEEKQLEKEERRGVEVALATTVPRLTTLHTFIFEVEEDFFFSSVTATKMTEPIIAVLPHTLLREARLTGREERFSDGAIRNKDGQSIVWKDESVSRDEWFA